MHFFTMANKTYKLNYLKNCNCISTKLKLFNPILRLRTRKANRGRETRVLS